MKILFFSDIHGVPATLQKTLEHAGRLQPDRLVLLGDALYHGPRNGVPGQYEAVIVADLTIFNPGSISLPKNGHPPTFGWFDGRNLSIHRLDDGNLYDGFCS